MCNSFIISKQWSAALSRQTPGFVGHMPIGCHKMLEGERYLFSISSKKDAIFPFPDQNFSNSHKNPITDVFNIRGSIDLPTFPIDIRYQLHSSGWLLRTDPGTLSFSAKLVCWLKLGELAWNITISFLSSLHSWVSPTPPPIYFIPIEVSPYSRVWLSTNGSSPWIIVSPPPYKKSGSLHSLHCPPPPAPPHSSAWHAVDHQWINNIFISTREVVTLQPFVKSSKIYTELTDQWLTSGTSKS